MRPAESSVAGHEEPGVDQAIQVEGRERPADPDGRGSRLATDRARLRGDVEVQGSPDRLGQRREVVETVVEGRSVHGSPF